MLATIAITPWHWIGFLALILVLLALDLGVFHKKAHNVRVKEALLWTVGWFSLAMAFGGFILWSRNRQEALEYVAGYVIELSLSLDNVFVIALIFSYFHVPKKYQHRVLFWGIVGALVMRGIMIGLGVALVRQFHWVLYIFGAFLIFTGIRSFFGKHEGVHPEKNPVLNLVRRFFPVSHELDGQKLLTRLNGRRALTRLGVVLLMVETTDLIFALDSIPAIFGVTEKEFIIFTSNVFAILGLRSLYFLLAGAIDSFRFLKLGLSAVLVFIGAKMVLAHWIHLSTALSLGIVAGLILVSILASFVAGPKPKAHPDND